MVKTTVTNNNEVKELPFPKLMISIPNGTIVLFLDKCVGVSITDKTISHSFDMNNFKDFDGSFTLENER